MLFSIRSRLVLTIALSFSCFVGVRPATASLYLENELVRSETDNSQRAILELLDYRMFAVKAVKELNDQVNGGTPLRADQLEPFHLNVIARNQIKEELLQQIAPYLDLVNHPEKVHTDVELFHYLQTMAIGYTLTDNYQDFVETIQNNNLLRHIANEENSSFEKPRNLLKKAVRQFYSVRFHRPTVRGARHFDELGLELDQKILGDQELSFFWKIIDTSATFQYLKNQNDFERITYDVGFFFKKLFGAKKLFKDIIHNSLADTVYAISKVFGNTVGMFQSRNGYLYHSKEVENEILSVLRPGDILLEKTPFRLTDKFIPGYWGHNAIWLGTEDQLKELGLWDDPKIQAIQDRIHDGKSILEALRPGVTTNRLEHFLDIDDFAILRRPNYGTEELKKAIIRAASQYGKRYDFGFDVETQNTLVCSELMFMTYSDVPYKLEKALGRYTINPDSVADAAVHGTFDVITLIKDGNFVSGNLRDAMRDLISKE